MPVAVEVGLIDQSWLVCEQDLSQGNTNRRIHRYLEVRLILREADKSPRNSGD
jgi:hypothetical protein